MLILRCLASNGTQTDFYSLGYSVLRHFQQYFSYIVEASFIGGGNLNIARKPPICRKSLTNFII
jgi:hypothetical protein